MTADKIMRKKNTRRLSEYNIVVDWAFVWASFTVWWSNRPSFPRFSMTEMAMIQRLVEDNLCGRPSEKNRLTKSKRNN